MTPSANPVVDGDAVTIVKSLKVKGSGGGALTIGTKVSSIRMIPDSWDGHDIEAKVAGFGEILLKSSVVKKAWRGALAVLAYWVVFGAAWGVLRHPDDV